MKNSKHALIAVLSVIAASSACAQSMNNQNYYGEIGYLPLKIKNTSNGADATPKLARITFGKEIDKNLSVEASYAFTASKDSSLVNGINYNLKANMFGLLLKPKIEIAQDVEAFARIGAVHSKYSDEESSLSKTKIAYGLGLQAQFTKDVYGQLDYMNYYKQDGISAKGFAVSIGMRF